jgi:hypothetical protein
VLRPSLYLQEFIGAVKFADVFHHEKLCAASLDDIEIRFPEGASVVARPFLIQKAETLAGRASDHYVRLGNAGFFSQPVVDIPANRLAREIGGMRGKRRLIVVHGQHALETAAKSSINKSQAHAAGAAKQVYEPVCHRERFILACSVPCVREIVQAFSRADPDFWSDIPIPSKLSSPLYVTACVPSDRAACSWLFSVPKTRHWKTEDAREGTDARAKNSR